MIYFSVVINNNCFIKTLSLIKQQSLYISDSPVRVGDVYERENRKLFAVSTAKTKQSAGRAGQRDFSIKKLSDQDGDRRIFGEVIK